MSQPVDPFPPGMGHAAFLLMTGLLHRLLERGVLSRDEIALIHDEAALTLEQAGAANDPSLANARMWVLAQMDILDRDQSQPKGG